jgi:hypothetical protein
MLTFLLDKQDNRSLWRSVHSRPRDMSRMRPQTRFSRRLRVAASADFSSRPIPAQLVHAIIAGRNRFSRRHVPEVCVTFRRCDLHTMSEDAHPAHLWLTSHAGVTRSR